MNYTILQLRGGTKTEHLSGNGTGFIGEPKEVTVDTTEWTLRVHDGQTVGGHKLALDKEKKAEEIFFNDGQSLQYKFDNGELGGGETNPDPPPPIHEGPKILTISTSNELSNGSATVTYYVEDKDHDTFTHSFSSDNGINFNEIKPTGNNPYTFNTKGLALGSNICAIKVDDGIAANNKYFIIDIPNPSTDTAPIISELFASNISQNGFKVNYKATDKENHSIKNHKISINNGYSYVETYPTISNGLYVVDVNELNPGTTYFCRLKVVANGLESNPYGFQVTTISQASFNNPLITDGVNTYKLKVENDNIVPVKCNCEIEKAFNEIILKDGKDAFKLKIINDVLSVSKI